VALGSRVTTARRPDINIGDIRDVVTGGGVANECSSKHHAEAGANLRRFADGDALSRSSCRLVTALDAVKTDNETAGKTERTGS
jgi:hypothetical protein